MNNFNDFEKFLANFQFDLQSIIILIVAAVGLYIAFRIGAFILKIVVGLAAIALFVIGIMKILPYFGL